LYPQTLRGILSIQKGRLESRLLKGNGLCTLPIIARPSSVGIFAEDGQGKLSDINMLVIFPVGRERTESEFQALFDAAGFELTRVVSTPGEVSVIEGRPR